MSLVHNKGNAISVSCLCDLFYIGQDPVIGGRGDQYRLDIPVFL